MIQVHSTIYYLCIYRCPYHPHVACKQTTTAAACYRVVATCRFKFGSSYYSLSSHPVSSSYSANHNSAPRSCNCTTVGGLPTPSKRLSCLGCSPPLVLPSRAFFVPKRVASCSLRTLGHLQWPRLLGWCVHRTISQACGNFPLLVVKNVLACGVVSSTAMCGTQQRANTEPKTRR